MEKQEIIGGKVIGKKAPDFTLRDQHDRPVTLSSILHDTSALLVFYPGDFTMVCTSQLCNYRDNIDEFTKFGLKIYGISANTPESHRKFAEEYKFPFLLLSDPNKKVAKDFGCTSLLMLGGISRAVFIINRQGLILYRYVEPTIITRRKSDELLGILTDLRKNSLI